MVAPIRVLHVDDDAAFADLTSETIERRTEQFTVETATDAATGLEMFETGRFDCIVSDYNMPGRNGIDFLEAVRERDSQVPFVLFTNAGSEAVASRAISAGVTDYVRKGSSTERYDHLVARIRNAVSGYRAERELDRRDELFEKAQRMADVGTWEWDPRTETGYYSEGVYDIYGVDDRDGDPESDIEEFYHPDDRGKIREAFRAAVEDGEPYDIEVRVVAADGTEKWVRTQGDPEFEDGTCVRVNGTIQDITDRKERERTVVESNERLQALFDNAPSEIKIHDEEGTLHAVNRRHVEKTGYDREELLAMNVADYEVGFDLPELKELWASMDIGETVTAEGTHRRTDGSTYPVEVRVSKTELGGEVRFLAFSREITDRKAREAALQRKNERLEAFAGAVSHDLRNPLDVARGRVELAREEGTGHGEHLDAAQRALDRMESLIADLLSLARDGEGVSDTEPVALAQAARASWSIVPAEDAAVEIDADGVVLADEGRLQQLLENLFRNAVEHAGSEVTITVGDLPDGFYVTDDGPGIADGEREQVFEPGYSANGGGTGLGLPIVEEIAEAHGWSVRLADPEDGGARFEITGVTFAE